MRTATIALISGRTCSSDATKSGRPCQKSRTGSGVGRSQKSSSTTVPPGTTSPGSAGSAFHGPESTKRRSNGASGTSTSRQSPWSTDACSSSAKSSAAAAARTGSSSALKNGTSGGSPERSQAAPTPVPVPTSPTRSRPRWAARSWSRRPTSGSHERVNPSRAASSPARRTSGGVRSRLPAVLPIPPHFDPERVGEVWRVPYEERAREAEDWTREHTLRPSAADELRVGLVAVDVQNTFCTPGFELFVGGRSGVAAVDDSRRLCEFLYRNLDRVTEIVPTMDTHYPAQIFHPLFLVDEQGRHPEPHTLITAPDVEAGRWRVNPYVLPRLGLDEAGAERYLRHYAQRLEEGHKYHLTVWPYHALLGGIGHALVPAVEEAIFFHSVARRVQPRFQLKGRDVLTEHYSVLGPEVVTGPDGRRVGTVNVDLLELLRGFDAVLIAGQAKSHCVAWTIADLLSGLGTRELAAKVYLLEDCTSPIVVPDVVDYTDDADAAFARFADAGMHVVRSTDPIESWPEFGYSTSASR